MKKYIVTIARQCGSGGREIAERIAELLGVPLYDRELITACAAEGNLHPDVAEKADEKATSSLLYSLAMGVGAHGVFPIANPHLPVNDRLFMLQSDYIRARAAEGGGVFLGRCADYVLRDEPDRFSVFLYASLADRVAHIKKEQPTVSDEAAMDYINKTDRRRSSYYGFYTGEKWGKYDNYHLAIDTHLFGIEGSAALIADAVRRQKENRA